MIYPNAVPFKVLYLIKYKDLSRRLTLFVFESSSLVKGDLLTKLAFISPSTCLVLSELKENQTCCLKRINHERVKRYEEI